MLQVFRQPSLSGWKRLTKNKADSDMRFLRNDKPAQPQHLSRWKRPTQYKVDSEMRFLRNDKGTE